MSQHVSDIKLPKPVEATAFAHRSPIDLQCERVVRRHKDLGILDRRPCAG